MVMAETGSWGFFLIKKKKEKGLGFFFFLRCIIFQQLMKRK